MRAGSTLVAFEVAGGDKAGTFRFLNALKLIRITNNLGDAKSLVTHPATTTHQRLTPEARAELGISDGLVRFSAGLEHPDDVVGDLRDRAGEGLIQDVVPDLVQNYGVADLLLMWTAARGGMCGRHRTRCGVRNCRAQELGPAAITPVVHVQAIGRRERVEVHPIALHANAA